MFQEYPKWVRPAADAAPLLCQNAEEEARMKDKKPIETKTDADGTTDTGPASLPEQSAVETAPKNRGGRPRKVQ